MLHSLNERHEIRSELECIGIDRVLKGWGRRGVSDETLLQRGGECFDALYEFIRRPA